MMSVLSAFAVGLALLVAPAAPARAAGAVWIAGTSWDLYRGNIGWDVFSFVRRSNTTSATLHLQDYLADIR